jgi:hypothetical protein
VITEQVVWVFKNKLRGGWGDSWLCRESGVTPDSGHMDRWVAVNVT